MAVTTNGWGAVNVAPIAIVNKSIEKQKKLPGEFTASSNSKIFIKTVSCSISGSQTDTAALCSWSKWEIAPGGSGHIMYLACTVGKAYAHFVMDGETDTDVYDISGSRLDISVDLKSIEDESYAIAQKNGQTNVLMVKADTSNPVNIQNTTTITNLPNSGDTQLYYSMVATAFENYFLSHLSEFKAVFGVIMLNAEIAEEDKNFKWLTPSAVSYACESNREGNYFGILTMLDNDKIGSRSQQIDTQVFDRIPKGANSALLIGAEKFCKHVLVPSAVAVITGSKESDFDIGSDRISVTNNKELKWDNFETGGGKSITPTIPTGGFDMRIVGSYIFIDITGMHYSPSAGITVTSSLTQKIELSIEKRADGSCVLIPKKDSAFNECKATSGVEVSEAIKITNIILDVVAVAASLACGVGALGRVCTKSACVTTEAASNTATIAIETASEAVEETVVSEAIAEGAASIDAIAEGASTVTKGGFFASNFCKVATSVTGVIGGLAAAGITAIALVKYIDEKVYDEVPSLNNFGMKLLSNFAWPEMKDAEIVDAELCDVLIMYTNIKE